MTLDTPVKLHQDQAEFAELLDLYRQRKPGRVLELGTLEGGTLYHWLQNANPGTLVVSIDTYLHADNRGRYHDWAPDGVDVVAIAADTASPEAQQAAAALGPFDWIFIDADHHEPNVRADWHTYRQLAAPDGVVVFHDIAPTRDPTVEVAPLWDELRATHDTIEFLEPGGRGLGVVLDPQTDF